MSLIKQEQKDSFSNNDLGAQEKKCILLIVNGMVVAKLKRDKQCFSSLGKL
jgi:hypothetical protein